MSKQQSKEKKIAVKLAVVTFRFPILFIFVSEEVINLQYI